MPTGCAGHFGRQNERSGALFAVIALYLQNFRYILKKSLESRLPRSVLRRSKSGFGVPLRQWIKCELREMVADLLFEGARAPAGAFSLGGDRGDVTRGRSRLRRLRLHALGSADPRDLAKHFPRFGRHMLAGPGIR